MSGEKWRWLLTGVGLLWVLNGCGHRGGSLSPDPPAVPGIPSTPAPFSNGMLPAGTSCAGREDCPDEQLCVANECRYRQTSASGEILAAGAAAQMLAGEMQGALHTYDQALEAYHTAGANPPADVVCAAAEAALRGANNNDLRDAAAKRADQCFRASVPGEPGRGRVATLLARTRFDGLDTSRFDRPEPSDHFFTLPPSRPTADAVSIAIDIEGSDNPGFTEVRDALRADPAKRAIIDCFIQDWEIRRQRDAHASLLVKYQSTLHDMGDYDAYDPSLEISGTTLAEDGFEPCLARALTAGVGPAPRVHRAIAWQQPLEISARLE